MTPTWDNGRLGLAFIAKRIDRFLLSTAIIEKWGMPIAKTGDAITSDHKPIFLEWVREQQRMGYSFKFNSVYLQDESFVAFVKSSWGHIINSEEAPFLTFREKINKLREGIKSWQIRKKQSDSRDLSNIILEINMISSTIHLHGLSIDKKVHLWSLEKRKQALLLKEEAS